MNLRNFHRLRRTALRCAVLACAAPCPIAHADCAQALQILSSDLRGVALAEAQKQRIGGIVDDARRYCWIHREDEAMGYIAKARAVANLPPPRPADDWETVPLESLEKVPPVTR